MDKFKSEVKLICIEDGKRCLVYDKDDSPLEEIKGLFNDKPIVYEYNKNLKIIYFEDIELKHLDRYEVCFRFEINKYRKSKDMIVEANNKFYIFNSIHNKTIEVDSTDEVYDYFDNLHSEVRDAF